MKPYVVSLLIILLVVSGFYIYIYSCNTNGLVLGTSRISDAEPSLKTIFLEKTKGKLEEISECILKAFLAIYSSSQVDKIINKETFLNDPSVIQIVNKCTFKVLRQLYFICVSAITTECRRKHIPYIVDWVLENVEYKEHTEDEIKMYIFELKKDVEAKFCWNAETINLAHKITYEKIIEYISSQVETSTVIILTMTEKYQAWFKFMVTIILNNYRENNPANSYNDFQKYISGITETEIDKVSDKAYLKLLIQIKIIVSLQSKWCKPVDLLVEAIKPIPFELFTDEQVSQIVKKILDEWCWDINTYKDKTFNVLTSIIQ